MATIDLKINSVTAATGWTNATVASLASVDGNVASGGTAGELIDGSLDNPPSGSSNTITLKVWAGTSGTINRQKQVEVDLYIGDPAAGGSLIRTFVTSNLTSTITQYSDTAFDVSGYSTAQLNSLYVRLTVTEGGGMPDSASVNIDAFAGTLDYTGAVDVTVPVTTVSGTGQVGDVTVDLVTPVDVTTVFATGQTGDPTVTGDANVPVTTVLGTGQVGDVTVSISISAPVTGVSATGQLGDETVSISVTESTTGESATGQVGSVTTVSGAAVYLPLLMNIGALGSLR